MNKEILEKSNGFWWYMSGLIVIAIGIVCFTAYLAMDRGGRFSDIPAYLYPPLILAGSDLYRRISFYLRNKTDKLILEENKITLNRSGVKKTFKPEDLKDIKINRSFGFIKLKTHWGSSVQLQPWMFGKTLGSLKKLIKSYGF